jgi:hypothetical protein
MTGLRSEEESSNARTPKCNLPFVRGDSLAIVDPDHA